jgi:hypothetical protein
MKGVRLRQANARENQMSNSDNSEDARQWHITWRLVGVALSLACVVMLTVVRRYL